MSDKMREFIFRLSLILMGIIVLYMIFGTETCSFCHKTYHIRKVWIIRAKDIKAHACDDCAYKMIMDNLIKTNKGTKNEQP